MRAMDKTTMRISNSTLTSLCDEFKKNNRIEPEKFEKYEVKRGLRNADGSGKAITLSAPADKNSAPIALFTFEYAKTEPDVMYGNVNGDNTIDVSDALLVCQFYLGNVAPTDAQNAAADVNGDGAVDVSDALMICQFYLGNITEFPAEKKS